MSMSEHGAAALHWSVATLGVVTEPRTFVKEKSRSAKRDVLQSPAVPEKVVHCPMANLSLTPKRKPHQTNRGR